MNTVKLDIPETAEERVAQQIAKEKPPVTIEQLELISNLPNQFTDIKWLAEQVIWLTKHQIGVL